MEGRERIVIVGFGWVGQANALSLAMMGYEVSYFDIGEPKNHYSTYAETYARVLRMKHVLDTDSESTCYVICVGDRVSDDGVQDVSAIRAALDSVKNAKGTVVLRSTILPDHLKSMKFDFYVPEFLHEKYAVEECLAPYFVVIGANHPRKKEPSFIGVWRQKTPKHFDGTPREAAFVKYLSNVWNATRIAFVNEFGDAVARPDSDAKVESIHRVVNFVLEKEMYQKYGRAFGGHCLPKDMRAFARWHGDLGHHTNLLRGAYESNEAHKKMEEKYTTLPEWFSAWPTPHMSGLVALRELLYSIQKNIRHPSEFINRRILGRS